MRFDPSEQLVYRHINHGVRHASEKKMNEKAGFGSSGMGCDAAYVPRSGKQDLKSKRLTRVVWEASLPRDDMTLCVVPGL